MSHNKLERKRSRTTNWATYNAAVKSRGSLLVWLDPRMRWLAQGNGQRGRDQPFSDAAIQFCLSLKCLYGLPLQQTMGWVEPLLALAGLDWPVPDYSTLSRRQDEVIGCVSADGAYAPRACHAAITAAVWRKRRCTVSSDSASG